MILKTALILKESGIGDFEWRVFGVQNLRFAESKTGIRASDVGVCPMGIVSAEQLRDSLLLCSVYVHPSYIDNSPNSVCEAQILGVPVVATNVGGVSSLFTPEKTCCLVPSNDPLMMASRIRDAVRNPELFCSDRSACLSRHNRSAIVEKLFAIYREISNGLSSV